MALSMLSLMLLLLLAGFPMMIPLIGATLLGFLVFFAGMKPDIVIQQMIGGIKPTALVAVPMFILAADIITKGHSADRLLDTARLREESAGRERWQVGQHLVVEPEDSTGLTGRTRRAARA